MKRFKPSSSAFYFCGILICFFALGFFWTQKKLNSYSQKWQNRGLKEEAEERLFIPSPVEAYLLSQTPNLWEKSWGPQRQFKILDVPSIYTASKSHARIDRFFLSRDEWEVGRILSGLANAGHLDLLAKALDYNKDAKVLLPPAEWKVENCDILYQEFYFRVYQLNPELHGKVLTELSRCDPLSPSRLWVLTDALKAFKGTEAQKILAEIKGISDRHDLRPYRKWFAEQVYKLGLFVGHTN